MADRLIQILAFENVGPGAQVSLPHNLNVQGYAVTPDYAARDNAEFTIDAVTSNSVTVTNTSGAPAACHVWLERKHTIQRAFGAVGTTALAPQPFVPAVGGGGGGGAVSVASSSMSGDGSAGDPLTARGAFVWALGTTWADLYAQMQAVSGPKLCLVEFDPNGARQMTGTAQVELSNVWFVGFSRQDNFNAEMTEISIENDVEILADQQADGVGNRFFGFLRSTNIAWIIEHVVFNGSVIDGGTPERRLIIDLDGGRIQSSNQIVHGPINLTLKNGAEIFSQGGSYTFGLDGDSRVNLYGAAWLRGRVFKKMVGAVQATPALAGVIDAGSQWTDLTYDVDVDWSITQQCFIYGTPDKKLYALFYNSATGTIGAAGMW